MFTVRFIVSFGLLIAIIAGIWFYFNRRQENKRRSQTAVLESMGLSVRREGIIGDPTSRHEITSACGHVQGYQLDLRVCAESQWDVSNQRSWYNPYTTISTTLGHRLSDLRINNRAFVSGDRWMSPPGPEDGSAALLGSSAFDDVYFLFCHDPAFVQKWFTAHGAERFADLVPPKEYVQLPDKNGNGLRIRGDELSLRISTKRAEQLDLKAVVSLFVSMARLFDDLGVRAGFDN